jgi:N-acetylneuraminic acid mutarotase
MHVARYRPSAALLADGRVLVAGGVYADEERFEARASAELFDPETGAWSKTRPMNTARYGARAVTLQDGRVLVVGGTDDDDSPLRSAEIYDPDSGRWASAGSLSTPRNAFTLTLLPDGSVLAAGGEAEGSWSGGKPLASVERFDPDAGTWSAAAPMASPRAEHVAAMLGDGRLLVAGGNDRRLQASDADEGFPDPTGSAEIYDPVADSWAPTVPLATPRAGASAVALPDGSVLVVGGYGSWGPMSTPYCPGELASAERYVPGGG